MLYQTWKHFTPEQYVIVRVHLSVSSRLRTLSIVIHIV